MAGAGTQKKDATTARRRGASFDFAGGPAARYLLLVGVTLLVALGLLMAFSASSGEAVIREVSQQGQNAADSAGQSSSITSLLSGLKLATFQGGVTQLAFIIVGVIIAFVISRIDYHHFIRFAVPLGIVAVAGLVAVFFFPPVSGAHRWIPIGSLTVQPSELVKPILLVIGASAFSVFRTKIAAHKGLQVRDWIIPALFIATSLVLILMEPDMGTTVIIGVGLASVWLLCDLDWRFPAVVGVAGAVVLAFRLMLSENNYGANRITSFIKTWTEGQTAFQNLQAQYALAGGGLKGVGPGLSRQKYTWLTQAQSDFILAIIGEELGFLGTLAVILSFVLILLCGMRIAARAKDRLGRSLAGGAIVLLIFQAVLNIFAVTSLIPVTGKPLPFVTAGGTSIVTSLALVGIVLSVSRYGAGRSVKEGARPASHLSLVIGGELPIESGRRQQKPPAGKSPQGKDRTSKGKPPQRPPHDKPPKKKRPKKKRSGSGRSLGKKEDENEDNLEWRWDSGAHLSGPGARH